MTAPRTLSYGTHADQVGDLYPANDPAARVLMLLHGGFWRMPYDRHECAPIARDLQERGFTVWNVEYRRVGVPGGGWPGTAEDVLAAAEFIMRSVHSDLIIIGHSAGGHLAIWTAFEARRRSLPGVGKITAAVGLAPVVDLVAAHQEDLGKSAAAAFLGGSPAEHPDRYRAASPRAMLPGLVRHAIIHGNADDYVPLAASRAYTTAARTAGDDVTLTEVAGGGHMDHLDPASPAHAALVRWLEGK